MVLLRIKYWTVWYIERCSVTTYTGVSNFQKTVRFFGSTLYMSLCVSVFVSCCLVCCGVKIRTTSLLQTDLSRTWWNRCASVYRNSSNRRRVSYTSRVSNRSCGSDCICSNRNRVSNTSWVSNRSRCLIGECEATPTTAPQPMSACDLESRICLHWHNPMSHRGIGLCRCKQSRPVEYLFIANGTWLNLHHFS